MKYVFAFLLLVFATKVTSGRPYFFDSTWYDFCGVPPIPANGRIGFIGRRGILPGYDVVSYRCNEGYTLHGTIVNTCHNRRWTQIPPTCRHSNPCLKRNVCPYEAKCRHTGGTSYSCDCSRGYTGVSLPGRPVHKCLKTCPEPFPYYQATFIARKYDVYKEGDKIFWRCNSGFIERSRRIITRTCSSFGFWMGSLPICLNQDECTDGTHSCHANATCTNTEGSFTCSCNEGLIGDGYNCTDVGNSGSDGVEYTTTTTTGTLTTAATTSDTTTDSTTQYQDECLDGGHSCHENAACTNTEGSFTCSCKDGYIGNGYKCRATCPPPAQPEGGVVDAFEGDVFVEGDVVQYRCSAGLELIGNVFATCRNHTFGVPPACRSISAEATGAPIPESSSRT